MKTTTSRDTTRTTSTLQTSGRPPLPTFLIVGTMKSGTSTLAAHLREHPDAYMPRPELHFFNRREDPKSHVDEYREMFSGWSGETQVGEKTPNYALMPDGPQKIADLLPDVRLIWSFRNPVERAYSNYWHAVKRGVEYRSFDTAIRKEVERIKGRKDPQGERIGRQYVMRSDYVTQVRRYLKYFQEDQMHYILFEDMVSDTERTLKGVMEFLGVDTSIKTDPERHAHRTHLPRVKIVQYLARRLFGDTKSFKRIARFNRRRKPGYPQMSADTRKMLNDEFSTWYPEFERITGLSTKKWLDGNNER